MMSARLRAEHGYAMAALLVAISIMAVVLSMALPVWNTAARREREAELVFRGEQYARAIGLFQRKYANTSPPNLDVLVNERFLRKKYKDPITDGEFQVMLGTTGQGGAIPTTGTGTPQGRTSGTGPANTGNTGTTSRGGFSLTTSAAQGSSATGNLAAAGGIIGVASKSTDKSLRLYNGRGAYNEWVFAPVQRTTQAGGAPGSQTPGGANGRGGAGQGIGPGRGTSPDAAGGRRGTGGLPPPALPGIRPRGQAF